MSIQLSTQRVSDLALHNNHLNLSHGKDTSESHFSPRGGRTKGECPGEEGDNDTRKIVMKTQPGEDMCRFWRGGC